MNTNSILDLSDIPDPFTLVNTIVNTHDFEYFYLIDFGLSYTSITIEDKAVDLYVLKRAIISANPKSEEIVSKIFYIV